MSRVLVVEDEESYSDALAYMLRKEGFEVAVAATGPDALDSFDRAGADLVLLDLMLPGLPGTGPRAAPGSGCRSSSTSPPPTAARCGSGRSRARARRSP